MSSDDEVREEKELDLSSNDVVTKYKAAAEILNKQGSHLMLFHPLLGYIFVEYSWQPKLLDEKQTTIYKRAVDKNYHLKMKASRFIFSEISQKFPIMPFTARALEEKCARLGLVECMNHELLQPYPVLHEKPGDLVAHIKFTVLLMPNGSDKITSHQLQELQPTKSIEDDAEIKAWLALGTKSKKKGGGKTMLR